MSEATVSPGVHPVEVIGGLNQLLQFDHDAVAAYDIAIERLENRTHALSVEVFKREHQRHIRDLNDVILSLGGTPTNEPRTTAPLKQALQRIASTAGDKALLVAWRSNENQLVRQYEDAVTRSQHWPDAARKVIEQNVRDERRHLSWVEDRLDGSDEKVLVDMRPDSGAAGPAAKAPHAAEKQAGQPSAVRGKVALGLAGAAQKIRAVAEQQGGEKGVRAKVSEGASAVSSKLQRAAGSMLRGSEGGEGGDLQERIATEIRNHPVRSVAGAFAVAFVIGRLLRK